MKSIYNSTLLRLSVTVGLLFLVFYKTGMVEADKRRSLLELLTSMDIRLFLVSIICAVALNLSSAVKWYMLLRSKKINVSLWRLYAYYMVGKLFNLILPTSMGGDVVRIHSLGRYSGNRAEAVASVLIERLSGMITLLVLTAIAVIVNYQIFNIPWITVSLAFIFILFGIVVWLIFSKRPLLFIKLMLVGRFSALTTFLEKISSIQNAVYGYRNNKSALVVAVINSIIFYMFAVVNVWVSALAFNGEVDLLSIIIAVPLILFIMNLPVSIGGLGLMEFAYTFIFDLIGFSPALGLSTALLMRFKTFIDAGIGGVIYPLINDGQLPKSKSSEKEKEKKEGS